jgi:hypothetical protein
MIHLRHAWLLLTAVSCIVPIGAESLTTQSRA